MNIEDLISDSLNNLSHIALVVVYRSRVYKPKKIPVNLFESSSKKYFRKPLDITFGCRKMLLDVEKIIGNSIIYRRCYLIGSVLVVVGVVHGLSLQNPKFFKRCKNPKEALTKQLKDYHLIK